MRSLSDNTNVQVNAGGANTEYPIGSWYRIKLTSIDWSACTYTLNVNGGTVATNIAFDAASCSGGIDSLLAQSKGYSAEPWWFDNVRYVSDTRIDNFEATGYDADDPPGWTITEHGTAYEIDSAQASDGSQSLKTQGGASDDHAEGYLRLEPNSLQPSSLAVDVQVNTHGTSSPNWHQIRFNHGSSSVLRILLRSQPAGYVDVETTNSGGSLTTISHQVWRTVRLSNIDWTNCVYDVEVGGSLVAQALTFDCSQPIDRVEVGSKGHAAEAWWVDRIRYDPSTPAPEPDIYEPDDDASGASSILDTEVQDRTIHAAGNEDWVEFTVSDPGHVEITTDGACSCDTVVYLYDSNVDFTASNDDGGSGTWSHLAVDLASAGTYYIRVFEHFNDDTIPAYTLTMVFDASTGDSGDAYEPDDSSTTAKTIVDGETQSRSIHEAGDVDWAVFTLDTESDVDIVTDGTCDCDTVLRVYDDQLNLLHKWDKGGSGDWAAGSPHKDAGTYYIRVNEKGGDGTIPSYTLSFSATVNGLPHACFEVVTTERTVDVNGGCSTDADGDPLTYLWEWGDGSTYIGGPNNTYSYTVCPSASVTITLTVEDDDANTDATGRGVTPADTNDDDGDGLVQCEEDNHGTSDTDVDSDDDGLDDGDELAAWNEISNTAWNTRYNRSAPTSVTNNLLLWDADGDGIKDGHEFNAPSTVFGTCTDIDGRDECPDPRTRDVYVHVNWMVNPNGLCFLLIPCEESYEPPEDAVQRMRDNFEEHNTAVPRLDEVKLHLYMHKGTEYTQQIAFATRAPGSFDDFYDWKERYFPAERDAVFRYMLVGYQSSEDVNTAGVAELYGDDFALFEYWMGSDGDWEHAWMHELGHTLMGEYNSLCGDDRTKSRWEFHNPDATNLDLDEEKTGRDHNQGHNGLGTCDPDNADNIQDVFSHSSDGMAMCSCTLSGQTYSETTWDALDIWKMNWRKRASVVSSDHVDADLQVGDNRTHAAIFDTFPAAETVTGE